MSVDSTPGSTSTPTPTPTPAAPAAATAPPPAPPTAGQTAPPAPGPAQTVTIPLDQLQAFTMMQERLKALESEQRQRDAAAQAEQVKALAAKGEIENAMRIQREQAEAALNSERVLRQQTEDRAKRFALDGELSRVLANQKLVPGGAEQLTQLWRNQLQVEPHGDGYQVRTPQFQNVQDFVAAQLAQPHYAHFLLPGSSGGTAGTAGGNLAAPTPPPNPTPTPAPKTLGEAVILHMQTIKGERTGDPRLDLSSPMGLRRTV